MVTAIDALLEEYKTIRAESLLSIQMQKSILAFGVAGIGALFGLGVQNYTATPTPLKLLIFFLTVPLLSYSVLILWLGELKRMLRAGQFMVTLSDRINREFEIPVITWELWLRDGRQMKLNYLLTIGMFGILAFASFVVGFALLLDDAQCSQYVLHAITTCLGQHDFHGVPTLSLVWVGLAILILPYVVVAVLLVDLFNIRK